MAFYAHPDVLDNGLSEIKTNCNLLALISGYTAGDSYATVTAAILASVAMTSTDFTISNGTPTNSRKIVSASGKQDTSADASNTSGQGVNNHFAFVDTANSKVLWVTEETSGQDIVSGNPVNFPALTLTMIQPVSA